MVISGQGDLSPVLSPTSNPRFAASLDPLPLLDYTDTADNISAADIISIITEFGGVAIENIDPIWQQARLHSQMRLPAPR